MNLSGRCISVPPSLSSPFSQSRQPTSYISPIMNNNENFELDENSSDSNSGGGGNGDQTVIFYACKNEAFNVKTNYAEFYRRLKSQFDFSVILLEEELGEGLLPFASLVIIPGIRLPFSDREVHLLTDYVANGGSILILAQASAPTSFYNKLSQHFGTLVNKDGAIRVVRAHNYLPQECYIENALTLPPNFYKNYSGGQGVNLNIVYPHGCTLDIFPPTLLLLSSSLASYPPGRPIGSFFNENGRVIVIGSGEMFSDAYLGAEENGKLFQLIIEMLVTDEKLVINSEEIMDEDLRERTVLHCTGLKAHNFRGVIQDIDEFIFEADTDCRGKIDPISVVSSKISRVDYRGLGDVLKAYSDLKLEKIPLPATVKPNFETPLPPLRLSLFPPTFRNVPPPPLELFDLDEEFSSVEAALGRETNKVSEEDLGDYINTVARLLRPKKSAQKDPLTKKSLRERLKTPLSLNRNSQLSDKEAECKNEENAKVHLFEICKELIEMKQSVFGGCENDESSCSESAHAQSEDSFDI